MEKTDLPEITLTREPQLDDTVFIAHGARVIGDVRMATGSSVWYNAVLRGDINYIEIGASSNIQDGCIVHLENALACVVADRVTVGHGAILHGCTIEAGCLIGMGATILSGAVIGRGSVIAAGAVIRENERVAPLSLMAGVPAKKIRDLGEETFEKNLQWAEKYRRLAQLHRAKGFDQNPLLDRER